MEWGISSSFGAFYFLGIPYFFSVSETWFFLFGILVYMWINNNSVGLESLKTFVSKFARYSVELKCISVRSRNNVNTFLRMIVQFWLFGAITFDCSALYSRSLCYCWQQNCSVTRCLRCNLIFSIPLHAFVRWNSICSVWLKFVFRHNSGCWAHIIWHLFV